MKSIKFKGETIQISDKVLAAIANKRFDRPTVIRRGQEIVWRGTFADCIPELVRRAEGDGIDLRDGPGDYSWSFDD